MAAVTGAMIRFAERTDCTARLTPEEWAGYLREYIRRNPLQYRLPFPAQGN